MAKRDLAMAKEAWHWLGNGQGGLVMAKEGVVIAW